MTPRFAAPFLGALILAAPAAAQDAPAAPVPAVVPIAAEAQPATVPALLSIPDFVPATPAAPAVDADAPKPPMGAPASFVLPAREADGTWRTPNKGLTADEVVWHVRVALNVAALGCRGPAEVETVAAYNALLSSSKAQLASASAGMAEAYKARHGDAWQQRHDDDMTRLYNFFAQPPAQGSFCEEARAVLREVPNVEPSSFAAWAAASLTRLEAPFTGFYDKFEGYKAQLAAYQGRHAAPVQIAALVSTPPVTGPAQ